MSIPSGLLDLFKLPSMVIPVISKEFKWVKNNGSYQIFVKRNGVFQVFSSGFDAISIQLSKPCILHLKIKLEHFPSLDWQHSLC